MNYTLAQILEFCNCVRVALKMEPATDLAKGVPGYPGNNPICNTITCCTTGITHLMFANSSLRDYVVDACDLEAWSVHSVTIPDDVIEFKQDFNMGVYVQLVDERAQPSKRRFPDSLKR